MSQLKKIPLSVIFIFAALVVWVPERVFALDLAIDSFTTPQAAQASTKSVVATSGGSATVIGGYRKISAVSSSLTGSVEIIIANHELFASLSQGSEGVVTVVWDGDSKPGTATSTILNSKVSLPACDAVTIGLKSFTPTHRSTTIHVKMFNPFAHGDQFLEGSLELVGAERETLKEIPISGMRVGGSKKGREGFPLGAIELSVNGSISLSSLGLRCPPSAFVNFESSDYELGFVGAPSGRRVSPQAAPSGDLGLAPQAQPAAGRVMKATPTATPIPITSGVCGDGIIQQGEECDSGAFVSNPHCVKCRVVCPSPVKRSPGDSDRKKREESPSPCQPPPTCSAPYKTCSQNSKRGGSQCCYDPNTEDCVAFSSWGHPIARCVPKQGTCQEPDGKECNSGRGDRACCPSDSRTSCAQGGGIAFCSFSACGPNQTPCTTATGFSSEATMCCSNETEQCTKTIQILGYLIQTCTAIKEKCESSGGVICMGNGAPRCCSPGTVCSASVDGFPNCVDRKRVGSDPVTNAPS